MTIPEHRINAVGIAFRRTAALLISTLVILGLVSGLTGSQASAAAATAPFLGTLGTSPQHAAAESAAGIKVAMMELSWRAYEPKKGVFNASYEKEMIGRLASLRAAGMRVTLGLGMHYTPGWVGSEPNSRFVDQYGSRSTEVNLVFNQKLRLLAEGYVKRVNQAMHLSSFWAIRVTSGAKSEVLYPQGGHYWAFDVNAQNGSALPKSQARNPFKGWKPGTAGLTTAQTLQWADWYVGALADTVRWQALTVQNLGFTGYIQVITPGLGVMPYKLSLLAASRLPNGTLGAGAAWVTLYSKLTGIPHLVAYLSSIGDGSGGNGNCSASDRTVPLTAVATQKWSSTRWMSRIADQFGFAKAGENPGLPKGNAPALNYYRDQSANGMMAKGMAMSRSCGFQGVYWAHDDQFWNGMLPLSSLVKYASSSALAPPSSGARAGALLPRSSTIGPRMVPIANLGSA